MQKQLLVIFNIIFLLAVRINASLLFVFEIYRHGARGPLNEWYDGGQQKDIFGELTATGQRQHFNLGAKLREEYADFLPKKFNHSQIYVRSSDVNRTILSAASQLQGMFPENTGSLLPDNLAEKYMLPAFKDGKNYLNDNRSALPNNIQVVPIHTESRTGDKVLQPERNCQNYEKLLKEFYFEQNKTIQFINQQFSKTYSEYSKVIGQQVKNFDEQHELESVLECDRSNGRYVPEFSDELRENSTYLTTMSWNYLYNQPQLLRALNDPFFKQIFEYINPVVKNNNTNGLKWVMFSAHDTNVHLISAALNFTSIECLLAQRFEEYRPANQKPFYNCEYFPHFTSNILFEVHIADTDLSDGEVKIQQNQFYFKIRRDGKFMKLCEQNSTVCSYDEFTSRIKYFTLDFDSVCNLSESNSQESKPNDSSSLYILGLVLQQIVILGCAYYIYKLKMKKPQSRFNEFNDIEIPDTRS